MVYCALPPWRLVRLQGRVASAASYPAWPVTEKARPKVLAFLCLWWILLGIKDEPSELSIDFEACGGTSCKGDRMVMGAGGCPLMAGGQACMTAPEAFLRVLKPAASPLRNLRSCRRMTGGWCARHPSVDPGGVAHHHHGCLWATLTGSISTWSSIPWSLRFAELTRGYRAMKPLASPPARAVTGIS